MTIEADAEPHLDPLVGGLTKPPMFLGVPMKLFIIELVLVVMIFINTKNLLMFFLFVPFHSIAYGLTVRDARFIEILVVWLGKCPMTRTRAFWGGDTYVP